MISQRAARVLNSPRMPMPQFLTDQVIDEHAGEDLPSGEAVYGRMYASARLR
jgi:hypothetical protein